MENSVLEKFIEDGLQNQSLVKIKEISKLRENLQTVVISKNLHLNQLRWLYYNISTIFLHNIKFSPKKKSSASK